MIEQEVKKSVCEWLEAQGFVFTVYSRYRQKFKSKWQKPGWPDVIAFSQCGPVALGLLIEVKVAGGRASQAQLEIAEASRKIGLDYIFAFTLEEAVAKITAARTNALRRFVEAYKETGK